MANRRHKLINATATPKTHTHVEADITDLGTYLTAAADEAITGDWTFKDQLGILDSTGADSVIFSHGGTDLTATAVNTTDFELVGFTGNLDLRDGLNLRIRDTGDTDWISMSHDGTDFAAALVNTTDSRHTGMTRDFVVGDSLTPLALTSGPFSGQADHGIRLTSTVNDESVEYGLGVDEGVNNRRVRLYLDDAAGLWGLQGSASSGSPTFGLYQGDTLVMSATSTVMTIPVGTTSFTGTTINLTPTGNVNANPGGSFILNSGQGVRAYDENNNHYSERYTENVTTTAGHRTVWNNTTDGGALSIQRATIADDGTATFDIGTSHAIVFIVTTYNRTAAAQIAFSSTQAPHDMGSGSLVAIGATNPNTDAKMNVWPSGSGTMSIKNRLGSSRTFTVFSMGDSQ